MFLQATFGPTTESDFVEKQVVFSFCGHESFVAIDAVDRPPEIGWEIPPDLFAPEVLDGGYIIAAGLVLWELVFEHVFVDSWGRPDLFWAAEPEPIATVDQSDIRRSEPHSHDPSGAASH